MSTKKYAVFTMDVETFGDTECISSANLHVDVDLLDGLEEYLKILGRNGIKATLFTVGDLAPRIADRLRPHIASGHRLAMHNHTHLAPMLESPEQFRESVREAKAQMEELFGVEVIGFRAPCFSMDKVRLNTLQELGFRYDSSHLDYRQARHTVELDLQDFQTLRKGILHKDSFYEFGLSKTKVLGMPYPVSGGGYVRLSVWAFIKTLLNRYIRKNDYYVFYLHPFELTKKKVPFIKELKSYDKYYIKQGIRAYGRRIQRIIRMLQKSGYEFVTFEEMVQALDANNREG